MSTQYTASEWRLICETLFGESSAAVRYWDRKIAEQGEDQRVLADEGQILHLMQAMSTP